VTKSYEVTSVAGKDRIQFNITPNSLYYLCRCYSWIQTFLVFWVLYAFFSVLRGVWILYTDISEHYVSSIFIVSVTERSHVQFG